MVMPPKELTPAEIESLLAAEDVDISEGQVLEGNPSREGTAKDGVQVKDLREPDQVVVYDTITGVPSVIRLYEGNNTLMHQLSKRREDGTRIFSRTPPAIPAVTLDNWCWFQPASPRYEEMRGMGMPTCAKPVGLRSPTDVVPHMEIAHPRQYKQVVEHDARLRADEDRELQRQQGDALVRLVERLAPQEAAQSEYDAPLAVESPAAEISPPEPVAEAPEALPKEPKDATCPECGKDGLARTNGIATHKRLGWCPGEDNYRNR